ncbi:hypothetical protein [Ferruginibacter sp.]
MTIEEAKNKAEDFAKSFGEIFPGIYYSIRNPQEYIDCFYFDFIFVDHKNQPPEEDIFAGGAYGVAVNKLTGICSTISSGAYSLLTSKTEEVYSVIAFIREAKGATKLLASVKVKYHFNSAELLELNQLVMNLDITPENILTIYNLVTRKE